MIRAGQYHTLRIVKKVEFGLYLDAQGEELLLPKRFAPTGVKEGEDLKVFVYHDSEDRLIATTQSPLGIAGDIVTLKVVGLTNQGAFLDWGLMKDLFIPLSQQKSNLFVGQSITVLIYIDEKTGRVAATEKFDSYLSNDQITLKELEEVDLLVHRRTELGFEVIINNKHIGLMHFGDVFQEITLGERIKGYIRKIRPDDKIDVMPGQAGYKRVESETGKILRLLNEKAGYLPFHDKSLPQDIYSYFGMSKKTFKMAIGALYKQQKISFTNDGIQLITEE